MSDSTPAEPKTTEAEDAVEPVEEPEEGEPTQSVEEGRSDGDRRNEEGEQEAQPAQPVQPAPVSVPDMNPVSRLSHHLSYEITQAAVVAGVLGILAFVVLGGRLADVYLWLRPTAPTSGQVTLLTVGEEALYLFDPSDPAPEVTPRALLAELVRFAHAGGASVVVLDFLLDRPCENDDLLASAAREHGAVVGAERFVVSDPGTGREFAAGPAVGFGDAVATGFANLHEEQHALFGERPWFAGWPGRARVGRGPWGWWGAISPTPRCVRPCPCWPPGSTRPAALQRTCSVGSTQGVVARR